MPMTLAGSAEAQASARTPRDRYTDVGRQEGRFCVLRIEHSIEQILNSFEGTNGQPVSLHEQATFFQPVPHFLDEFQTVSLIEVSEWFQREEDVTETFDRIREALIVDHQSLRQYRSLPDDLCEFVTVIRQRPDVFVRQIENARHLASLAFNRRHQ